MKTHWWGGSAALRSYLSLLCLVLPPASLCPLTCPLRRPNTCRRGSYNQKVRFCLMHPEMTPSSWQVSIRTRNDYTIQRRWTFSVALLHDCFICGGEKRLFCCHTGDKCHLISNKESAASSSLFPIIRVLKPCGSYRLYKLW